MAILEKIEFGELGPCRFIGKSVYAPPGSGELFGALWGNSEGIFEAIDKLKDYFTEEVHNVALLTWDRYTEENKVMGYTVGRFMKAGAPVPEGLDFIDLPGGFVAKGWVKGEFDDMIQNAEALTAEAAKQQDKYELTWKFMAEVYTDETIPEDGVSSVLGYYIACKEKE
jgi:effector-binding domain-containing protein